MQERTEPFFYSTNEIFEAGLTSKVCLSIIYVNLSPFCVTKREITVCIVATTCQKSRNSDGIILSIQKKKN